MRIMFWVSLPDPGVILLWLNTYWWVLILTWYLLAYLVIRIGSRRWGIDGILGPAIPTIDRDLDRTLTRICTWFFSPVVVVVFGLFLLFGDWSKRED